MAEKKTEKAKKLTVKEELEALKKRLPLEVGKARKLGYVECMLDEGYSNSDIQDRLGFKTESSVRALVNTVEKLKTKVRKG